LHRSTTKRLALMRYLCLLINTRIVIHMQLKLPDTMTLQEQRSFVGGFHRLGLVAFAVDPRTLLLAADLRLGLAFTDLAEMGGVLSERLRAHTAVTFGQGRSRTQIRDDGVLRRLKSLLSAVAYVDFAKPHAFAKAGFDITRICSNPRYR
jgi:hypothetical protein